MEQGQMFDGERATFLSNMDTAMDSFSPDPTRHSYQINRSQLKAELEAAIKGLQLFVRGEFGGAR